MLKSITLHNNVVESILREAPLVGKRTTIIFDQRDRQYLENLIRDGKEPGIKPFIAKMVDVYRTMAIHDWKFPGEYYIGISRAAFFSQEDIQLMIDLIPDEKTAGGRAEDRTGHCGFDSGKSQHRSASERELVESPGPASRFLDMAT